MWVNGVYENTLCAWCRRMGINPESGCADVVPPEDADVVRGGGDPVGKSSHRTPGVRVVLDPLEVEALREVLSDPETLAPLLWITDWDTETRREYEHAERADRLAALAAVAVRLAPFPGAWILSPSTPPPPAACPTCDGSGTVGHESDCPCPDDGQVGG